MPPDARRNAGLTCVFSVPPIPPPVDQMPKPNANPEAAPPPPDDAAPETGDATQAVGNEDALADAMGPMDEGSAAGAPEANGASDEPRAILCPYCGYTQPQRGKTNRCDVCGGLFEPLSRRATQIAMGPWFIRDQRNPFRPGCSFDVIKKLVEAGKIGPTTVVRGPTTRQFWSIARNVPGLCHLLGFCHACRQQIEPGLKQCPLCEAEFREPHHRNELGLMYPNHQSAEAAQRALDRELSLLAGKDMVGIDENGEPVDHHPEPPPPEEKRKDVQIDEGDDAPQDLLADAIGLPQPVVAAPAENGAPAAAGYAPALQPPPGAMPQPGYAAPTGQPPQPGQPTAPAAFGQSASIFTPTSGAGAMAGAGGPEQAWHAHNPAVAAGYPPTTPAAPSGPAVGKPWVVIALIAFNVLVALAILIVFLIRTSPA